MRESVNSVHVLKNDLTSVMGNRYTEDKEYEHSESCRVVQQKTMFGYKDSDFLGPDPQREYAGVDAGINDFVQFCKTYDLPYEISESTEYGEDQSNFNGGRKGRYKTVTKTIVFNVPSSARQRIIHEHCAESTEKAKDTFIQRSGDWYERLKGSEAVKVVADRIVEAAEEAIENAKKNSEEYLRIQYSCSREEVLVQKYAAVLSRFRYEDLGYENLSSDEQEKAVTAAVMPYIIEALRSRTDLFDVCVQEMFETSSIINAIISMYFTEEIKGAKNLKAW